MNIPQGKIPSLLLCAPISILASCNDANDVDISGGGNSGGGGNHSDKPNIILILADDLGYNDLGYTGAYIKTPNIDQLAKTGVRMESFYTCPVSSPTRIGTMTGRYPIRMGLMRSVIGRQHKNGVPTSEVMIPEMLADAGYNHRGAFGKWHMGHLKHEWLPMQRGFTDFVGCYNGANDYFNKRSYGVLDWHHKNKSVDEEGYVTDLIGTYAAQFITKAPDGEPYFLYVPFTAPHGPHKAKQEDIVKYPNLSEDEAIYAAMIDNMDQNIGKILNAAKSRGDLDNTLIIFYSDNGGVIGKTRPGVMKGGKFFTYEGGIRVAAFANWPKGGITGGRLEHSQMGYIDIYPTIKAAAYGAGHTAILDKKPLDGINLLPILQGKEKGKERLILSYIDQNEDKIERYGVNYGTKKLHVNRPALDNTKPSAKLKITLFNLNTNHAEIEIHDAKLQEELYKHVDEFMKLQPENHISRYADGQDGFTPPHEWTPTE